MSFAGVYAATTTPFRADGSLDVERYEEHCAWLTAEGVDGIIPNGSLGEYEALTDAERAGVVTAALAGAGGRIPVVPGVSGKSGAEARRWAEHAAQAGAPAVMALPPTSHKPTDAEVVAHYAEVAKAGLPIIAYNNPFSTRVDLTPELLALIAAEVELVVAVKEFSQDVRRIWRIREEAPRLEPICGCDDTFVESMLAGATGWIAGFVNAFPAQSVRLHRLCAAGDYATAAKLYRAMLPILRWDADPRFVQAIKLGQEEAGRYGGPVRLPRLPLTPDDEARVRAAARAALEAGC
ncbi:MAG TPA: dihydrodipicolinate synthase family protein [Streptosporangiaceae bacterium]|nr:dihydrodipicolinate synthase family protein [Streptosporangiaceae bacterium]